ncbi:protein of unknown function [Candidatus Nitrosocosmicus franklandus]|uniref:Uncharacterized protein n=1 Tax=Candidatus Nitrosocosmicus franklandianus TaxID=1798806 RepID=A0A484ICK1_9ARCH|nr:protein of unknown function [Candidatus Nitrosocosmicus franklandus]
MKAKLTWGDYTDNDFEYFYLSIYFIINGIIGISKKEFRVLY